MYMAPPPGGVSLPEPIEVDGMPGWLLPSGVTPGGSGQNVRVLVVDPAGTTRLVERHRIATQHEAA